MLEMLVITTMIVESKSKFKGDDPKNYYTHAILQRKLKGGRLE